MDLAEFKQHLYNNPDELEKALELLGYIDIKNNGKELRFAQDETHNKTGCRVKLTESLSAVDFVNSIDGSVFDLIAEHRSISLHEAVILVKKALGMDLSYNSSSLKIHKPFGSIFTEMTKGYSVEQDFDELRIIPEEELNQFPQEFSLKFLQDNISLEAQKFFDIRYDYNSHRIGVIWRDENHNPIGIMGRANYSGSENKWIPYYGYNFPKNRVLFGYSHNKEYIKDTLLVAESEKSVMQAFSMVNIVEDEIKRIRNVVALGGSIINPYQVKLIHGLGVKKIILAFDEGLDVEKVIKELNKLKSKNPFMPIKLGYIYDINNKYLPLGSKNSPFDNGATALMGLLKECVIWIN